MIRVKGIFSKGKLILSEPMHLEEGMELDVIAYAERTTGESFDKMSSTLGGDSEDNPGKPIRRVTVGSMGKFVIDKEAKNDVEKNVSGIQKTRSIERETIEYKIKSLIDSIDLITLVNFLEEEHPQLIAIITEMMDREQAKTFLESLPNNLRGDIIYRIAKQQKVSSNVLNMIYEVLNKKLSQSGKEIGSPTGGMESAIDLLNMINKNSEKDVINYIDSVNKDFSEEIKKRLFKFEDITLLDDTSFYKLLDNVDISDLAVSLKGISSEQRKGIISKISDQDKRDQLGSELRNIEPVHIISVEKAQNHIMMTMRRMEEEGKLIIKTEHLLG